MSDFGRRPLLLGRPLWPEIFSQTPHPLIALPFEHHCFPPGPKKVKNAGGRNGRCTSAIFLPGSPSMSREREGPVSARVAFNMLQKGQEYIWIFGKPGPRNDARTGSVLDHGTFACNSYAQVILLLERGKRHAPNIQKVSGCASAICPEQILYNDPRRLQSTRRWVRSTCRMGSNCTHPRSRIRSSKAGLGALAKCWRVMARRRASCLEICLRAGISISCGFWSKIISGNQK